jgi:hypothetical protein
MTARPHERPPARARVCADQRADGRRTDGPRIRTSRKARTIDVEDGQVKASLDVPLSDAAADVLWRIIDRARNNRQS